MPLIEALKEELALLRVILGVLLFTSLSLMGWAYTNPTELLAIPSLGLGIGLIYAAVKLVGYIYDRLQDILRVGETSERGDAP